MPITLPGATVHDRQRTNLVVDQQRGCYLHRHIGSGCNDRRVYHLAHAAGLVLVGVMTESASMCPLRRCRGRPQQAT